MKNILIKLLSYFIFWSSKSRKRFLSKWFIDNYFYLLKDGKEIKKKTFSAKGLKFEIKGKNNIIKISDKAKFTKSKITIAGDNNYIEINETFDEVKLNISVERRNNTVFIWGKNSSSVGTTFHLHEDNAKCIVGSNCMFSYNVEVWVTDAHALLDKETKKVINKVSEPLTIGDNCWVGYGSLLTKNARLPNNTVVGAGSVVCKNFEKEYTAIAGNPAKVIKEGVLWDRKSPCRYGKENQ